MSIGYILVGIIVVLLAVRWRMLGVSSSRSLNKANAHIAHLVNEMDVLLRFFGEELEIQEPEEVDARQLVLLAGVHRVLDDTGDVVFHAVAEEVVTLLLDFHQHLFAGVRSANNVQNAVLLVENAGEFLHFQGDVLDGVVTLQAKHRVHERDEERVVLFLGEDDLEDAVTKDIGVLVKFLVLEEVALVDFHRLEQGVMLRTVHIMLSFPRRRESPV